MDRAESNYCVSKWRPNYVFKSLIYILSKNNTNNNNNLYLYNLYILRQFRKLVITFFSIKNAPKLINQQLKNEVKIVNWQKEVSYWLFYCKKYSYLKLKNEVKIVN